MELPLNALGKEPSELLLQGRSEDLPELKELGCGGPLTGLAKAVPTPGHDYVELTVRGSITLECGRCLENLTGVFEVRPKLLVEKKEQKGLEWVEHDKQGVEEYLARTGPDVMEIPLEHIIAEQIILNYNLNPLPSLDEKNRCMQCGRTAQGGEAPVKGNRIDPRWEKLRSLGNKYGSEAG